MADFDEAAVRRVTELFQTCRARHRESYPRSPLDFDQLDLTGQLTHGNWAHAKGHFADVYKGNMSDGTTVAVKTLRLPTYNLQDDDMYRTALLRFFREIHIWRGLDHPNVAPCLGYTLSLGNISLVSPWCDKGNLVQFLRTSRDISGPNLILDVTEGIQYLHTRSDPLVHGDLKGANILVNEHGIALLADFGISKQIDDMNRNTGFTTTSGVKGTMPWMAPELKRDSPLTFPCDIYSCAGVFLEICCPGKTPFHYLRQEWDLLLAKIAGTLPDLAQYPEMTGKTALWEIMCTCWTQDPLGRPTITDLVKSLYSLFKLSSRANQTVTHRPGEISTTDQNGANATGRLRQGSMESGSGQRGKRHISRLQLHHTSSQARLQLRRRPRPSDRSTKIQAGPKASASLGGTLRAQSDGRNGGLTMSQLLARKVKDVPAKDLKRGEGWCAIHNPQATRTLDIKLVMTLPHDSAVWCVRFSPDGTYLAIVCEGVAYVRDTKTGETTRTLVHVGTDGRNDSPAINSLGFSPDGQLVVTGAHDGGVRVWDLAEGKVRNTLHGHTNGIMSVAFSPNGSHIVSGSWDGTCRIWDPLKDPLTCEVTVLNCIRAGAVFSVAFSPNGLFIASGHSDGIVRIWDAFTGDLVKELKGHRDSGSDDGTVKYWSMEPSPESQVHNVASPNGGIVRLSQDTVIPQRGENGTGCITSIVNPQDVVSSLATTRDGSWVVGGSANGVVGFWDVNNPRIPQLILKGHQGWVRSVDMGPAFTPGTVGGLLAIGSGDGLARIWSYNQV